MQTVAVIVVTSPKVFSWLGHMPIMNWSYTQLTEVRGIDRVICVASKDLAARCKQMFAKDDIETVTIPDRVLKQGEIDKWLVAADGPAAAADVIALIKPTSPFLPAAKIEGCIDLVRRDFADTCCTVQKSQGWTEWGARPTAYVEVPGCRAFSPRRVQEQGRRFRPVTVSLIESLDVTDADNHRVAKALVAEGTV